MTLVSMCILPPTASEAMAASEAMTASKRPRRPYDLRLDISNLDYPGVHVHIASNGLRGHCGPQTTSEVTSKFNSVASITYVPMSLWLPKASMR